MNDRLEQNKVIEPTFPITVYFDDGTKWELRSPDALAYNLEWFDSDEGDDIQVLDANGRRVSVKVEALELKRLMLAGEPPAPHPPQQARQSKKRAA
jgi:hypothetical protein